MVIVKKTSIYFSGFANLASHICKFCNTIITLTMHANFRFVTVFILSIVFIECI